MIQFQEYLQSEYPGFASFIDTIIKPIFGESFHPDKDLQEMIDYPEDIDDFDKISNNRDEDFKAIAAESGLERLLELGTIQVQGDTRPIYVYDITVSNQRQLSRNRKGIQQLIARTLSNQSGAFMLFHYKDDAWEWRFSYKFVGKDKEDTTDSKRYTYLLGKDQVCKTAAQRFTNLLNKKGKIAFEDITEAFSVEKVSKEFFDHYRGIYADIICYVTGKRMVKSGNKWEEKQEHEPNEFIMEQFAQFAAPEKSVRDYVKKLMGRLVFLQFIQKKGWLGVPMDDASWTKGDKEFIQHLFAQYEKKDNFIDDILEPLFKDINSRRTDDIAGNWSDFYLLPSGRSGGGLKIPYLNGGLFEKDAEDDTQFPLPAHFMDEMLNQFFSAYNFTIDENDPSDAEVGVDPEMLGRVFENLLEDNKDKGAFYTPKEIVQYMCRESLIAYLQTDIEDDAVKQSFRDFVTTHEVSALNPADVYKVDKKLREVKICDPAIGSGAFPMGLLKELFDCRMAIEGEEERKTPAEIKKDIIQNSIYGVDIEKGAVDIARLRFWLSLIIDEQTPHALPNMDFKIMQGNSLLEKYQGFDLTDLSYHKTKKEEKHGVQMSFFDSLADISKQRFSMLMSEYYHCGDHERKVKIRKDLKDIVQQQIEALGYSVSLSDIDDIHATDKFFLWHTWFGDVFGESINESSKEIDILNKEINAINAQIDVINESLLQKEEKSLTKIHVLTAIHQGDTVKKQISKIKKNVKNLYGEITADVKDTIVSESSSYLYVINSLNKQIEELNVEINDIRKQLNSPKISSKGGFDIVIGNPPYKILTKNNTDEETLKHYISDFKSIKNCNSKNLFTLFIELGVEILLKNNGIMSYIIPEGLYKTRSYADCVKVMHAVGHTIQYVTFDDYVFENAVTGSLIFEYQKLLSENAPLHYQFDTSYNLCLCIDEINGIISKIEDNAEKLKDVCELFKGMVVKDRTTVVFEERNDLPDVFLLGKSIYQWSIVKEFYTDYNNLTIIGGTKKLSKHNVAPRIVIRRTGDTLCCAYVEYKALTESTLYSCWSKRDGVDNLYVIGLLNSSLLDYYNKKRNITNQQGFPQILMTDLQDLPIKIGSPNIQAQITSLVTSILSAKKLDPQADTSAEEQEIDQLVYKLYNLTPEEIAIVEGKNE